MRGNAYSQSKWISVCGRWLEVLGVTAQIHTHSRLFLEKGELLTQPRASLLPSVYCHDGCYAQTLTPSETFHLLSFF